MCRDPGAEGEGGGLLNVAGATVDDHTKVIPRKRSDLWIQSSGDRAVQAVPVAKDPDHPRLPTATRWRGLAGLAHLRFGLGLPRLLEQRRRERDGEVSAPFDPQQNQPARPDDDGSVFTAADEVVEAAKACGWSGFLALHACIEADMAASGGYDTGARR